MGACWWRRQLPFEQLVIALIEFIIEPVVFGLIVQIFKLFILPVVFERVFVPPVIGLVFAFIQRSFLHLP